jgi:hypothetical protein
MLSAEEVVNRVEESGDVFALLFDSRATLPRLDR